MYLLGVPQFDCGPLVGRQRLSAKAQALLCYLAMTGRIHTRAALAALLWGEHGEEEARRNLRKVIQELRSQLEPYLAIDHHTVGLHSPDLYWVDALDFAGVEGETQHVDSDRLQSALALYRADFLDGFYVRDAPAFETWMLAERARLRDLMLGCLSTLGERHAAEGDLSGAIATIRRLLELEPWREDAHRRLMGWLEQSGQRNAALVQYDICCRVLAEELGVEPDADTRDASHAPPAACRCCPKRLGPARPPVPVVDFTLVGRKAEWHTLRTAWTRTVQSGTQMVFVAGEAGIGKTRLAEELLLHVQRQGHIAVRARAYALEGRLAYAPLADWLRSPPLQASLARLDHVWLRELARLLPELLIQHPDLPSARTLDRTLAAEAPL